MVWRNFAISKIKSTVQWTIVIDDINAGEVIGTFYEKELQKTNQNEFKIEKVIKKKGKNFKCKGFHNSFNSCINKKDIV